MKGDLTYPHTALLPSTIHLLSPSFCNTLSPSSDRRQNAFDSHQGPRTMATTKKDLIDRIAETTSTKRTLVKTVVQDFFDEIIAELAKGNRLEFRDFGVFETKTRPARAAQNPKTLEKIEVPAKRRVVFKPGRLMREGVNGSLTRDATTAAAACEQPKT